MRGVARGRQNVTTISEETERIEREVLSPNATLAAETKGREHPEDRDPLRVPLFLTHWAGNITQFMRSAGRAGNADSSSSASCEMAASKSCPSYSVV